MNIGVVIYPNKYPNLIHILLGNEKIIGTVTEINNKKIDKKRNK